MYYTILDKIRDKPPIFIGVTMVLIFIYQGISLINFPIAILIILLLLGSLMIVSIYNNPIAAILINLCCGFIMFFICYRILKIKSIPLGFILDGLNFIAILFLLLRKELSGFKSQIGILLIIWLSLCFIEVINPLANSRAAWIQSIRQIFNLIAPFFIFYSLFRSSSNVVKPFLITWITMCSLAAIYTIYQELVGLPSWDYDHIHKDEMRKELYYTFGRLRKIAFLDNPTENGLLLCVNFMFCFGLAFKNEIKNRYKILFLTLAFLSAWGMIYTGTRTATVLFVLGAGMYIILKRSKLLLAGSAICIVLLTGYIVQTGGGAAISVMSTAFDDEDPSLKVRYNNQKILRSYIYRAPFGFGMGSTGYLGEKYSPHTFLGSFPPDSEYVRIIIELGFIGLAFYLYLYYVILSKAADGLSYSSSLYFSNLRIIIVVVLFVVAIGHYPQEIMGSNPFKILVGFCLAFISTSNEDIEKQII
ncbi:MAG: O-antigen ligase family protein [Reichenbachiella sp.]